MSKLHLNITKFTLLLFVISGVSACSTINNSVNKVGDVLTGKKSVARYDNNKSVKDLEFPPDLTTPEFDKAFELPTGTVSAVSMKNAATPTYSNPDATVKTSSVASTPRTGNLSSIKQQGGESYLQINDRYERALLLTEIVLERMQFKVVNKIPATGEINVRYQGVNPALMKNGNYRVTVINAQGVPLVRIAKSQGDVLTAAEYARVITLLNNEFNK